MLWIINTMQPLIIYGKLLLFNVSITLQGSFSCTFSLKNGSISKLLPIIAQISVSRLVMCTKSNALRILFFCCLVLLWFPTLVYHADVKDSPVSVVFFLVFCFFWGGLLPLCVLQYFMVTVIWWNTYISSHPDALWAGGKPAVTADGRSDCGATLSRTEVTFWAGNSLNS